MKGLQDFYRQGYTEGLPRDERLASHLFTVSGTICLSFVNLVHNWVNDESPCGRDACQCVTGFCPGISAEEDHACRGGRRFNSAPEPCLYSNWKGLQTCFWSTKRKFDSFSPDRRGIAQRLERVHLNALATRTGSISLKV